MICCWWLTIIVVVLVVLVIGISCVIMFVWFYVFLLCFAIHPVTFATPM